MFDDSERTELATIKMAWTIENYDLVIDYHPGKGDVVTDALIRKSLFALRSIDALLNLEHNMYILAKLRAKPLFL